MQDTSNNDCRILFDVLLAQGLKQAVLSPGSRNAPLLIAASARPALNLRIVNDERVAAFMALGMAITSRKPVLIGCTSGTALFNYAPAIAEAFYQNVPVIVVSADRPKRWIDQDDSQTMHQSGVLSSIVKRSYNITLGEGENNPATGTVFNSEREWFVNRIVNEAWLTATSGKPGPVHINIQIDNPVGAICEVENGNYNTRVVKHVQNISRPTFESVKELALSLAGKRVLVTAGFMTPDHKLTKALTGFLNLPNVAVMAEPVSNLHISPSSFMVDAVLAHLTDEQKACLRPDVVISIGGALVSRMLKEFIRRYQPAEHWTLEDTDMSIDCFQALTTHIDISPYNFFHGVTSAYHWLQRKHIISGNPKFPGYTEAWNKVRENAARLNQEYLDRASWSELSAFNILFDMLPENCNMFFSNGTSIRYASLLLRKIPHACYGNRGVSGIEGTSATALGCALNFSGLTILFTGDMSFGYYPNILGNEYVPDNFKIIYIDNNGGGIFRFIPPTRSLPCREELFCSPATLPVEELCRIYNWKYFRADSAENLRSLIPTFLSESRAFIHIVVNPQLSADTLIGYLK